MSNWVEEERDIKTVAWVELKDGQNPNDVVLIPIGGKIEAEIESIEPAKNGYKFVLKIVGEEKPVWMWTNASIERQHEKLCLEEGERIQIELVKEFETNFGNPGRDVKIRVDRPVEDKKKK